jgi:hypothetical protein
VVERICTVIPATADDAHRLWEAQHDLAAILSHVETRQVRTDYTLQYEGKVHAMERADIATGLRGSAVRVEHRRDGRLAIAFGKIPAIQAMRTGAQGYPAEGSQTDPRGTQSGEKLAERASG